MISDIILQYMQDGVVLIGNHGRIIQISQNAKKILNIKDDELDQTISSLFFKDHRNDNFYELVLSTIYEKNQVKNEIQEYYSGDKLYILTVTASCIQMESETYILLIFNDITDIYELKDARQALKKIQNVNKQLSMAKDEAEKANLAKSNFLSNMSHEIRTPLNAVLGLNEMIMRECEDSQILSYSKSINDSGKMLLSLINDILDFSKIESGKMNIVPVEYDLGNMLRELYHMIVFRAQDKSLEVSFKVEDKNTPARLFGDEVRVKQIITNILTNAVKYTQSGGVYVTVSYKQADVESDNIILVVRVKDTGIGIKEEDIHKLFKKFERIEEKRNRNIEGTGLGMSITLALLHSMDGSIRVNSEYGKGSEFIVEIPQKVIGDSKVENWDAEPEGLDYEETAKGEKIIAPDAKALVVDDNPMNRMVIRNLLKRTKIAVSTVESGFQCLDMAQVEKYDIIFMDHMMPDMDGIETLTRLKQCGENKNINTPVIMLTANAIDGVREQYLNAGFCDYLSKPIESDKLEQIICKYIDGNKIKRVSLEETKEKKQDLSANVAFEKALSRKLDYYKKHFGIDMNVGLEYQNNDFDFYLDVISNYERVASERKNNLKSFAQKSDCANFAILAHAIKGDVRMLGAIEFGEIAYQQEMAGKEAKIDFIREHLEEFLEEFDKVNNGILKILKDWKMDDEALEVKTQSKDMSHEEVKEKLKEIVSLIDEFEEEKAVEIMKELLNNNLERKDTDILNEALIAIEKDYDADKAAELIGGIL